VPRKKLRRVPGYLFLSLAAILSLAMMLDHVGQRRAAERIEASVHKTLEDKKDLTADLGGSGITASLTERLIANLPN